jgi:hypothetical protein
MPVPGPNKYRYIQQRVRLGGAAWKYWNVKGTNEYVLYAQHSGATELYKKPCIFFCSLLAYVIAVLLTSHTVSYTLILLGSLLETQPRISIDMKKQVSYLQKMFYDLWNDFGSVYLIVNNSERTQIGRRGFTEDEKKHGLILIFNDKTNNKLDWDEEGNLSCVLAFGMRKEDVYIYHDDLVGVFSPDAGVQLLRGDVDKEPAASPKSEAGEDDRKRVISLDKYRKKGKDT